MKQLFIIALFWLPLLATAQENEQRRFSASILAGVNLSQIDGDAAAGFNKIGANVGARGSIFFTKRFELSLELLYSNKGSFCGKCIPRLNYDLHYAEIPVEFNLREWFTTDGKGREYARILLGVGAAYNQLVFSTVKQDGIEVPSLQGELRKHSVLGNISLTFFFTRNFGLNFRWARSLYSLRPRSSGSLIMHLLTFRAVYAF